MSQNPLINPQLVETIYFTCLKHEGEDTDTIEVEGIIGKSTFVTSRLDALKAEIETILGQLSTDFNESTGGGTSFLQACMDKNGNLWTSLHERMDQLFQLGIAIRKVKCMAPRNLWAALPGGMPYYVIAS